VSATSCTGSRKAAVRIELQAGLAVRLTTVIVDANLIVQRDWRIGRPWWSVLLGLCATNQIDLVVPEVVIREVVGRFGQELASPARELKKLGLNVESEQEKTLYEVELRRTLVESGATIADSEPISVLDLATRAVRRARPFNDQGNGFRDSLIWMHVLEAARGERSVVFLSNDSGFCEGKGADRKLHSELVAEAESVGDISWFADIGTYLESTGRDPALSRVEAEVLQLIVTDWSQVAVKLATAVDQSAAMVYGADETTATVVAVNQPIEMQRLRVIPHPSSDDSFLVVVEFRAPLIIDVDEASAEYSEIHRGIELNSVMLEVDAIYDSSLGVLDHFGGGLVELEWVWISAAIAAQRATRRRSTQQAFGGFDVGQSAAVLKAFEGFDVGQSAAVLKAFEGFDVGQSAAVLKAFEGFDVGQSAAVLKAFEGFQGAFHGSGSIPGMKRGHLTRMMKVSRPSGNSRTCDTTPSASVGV